MNLFLKHVENILSLQKLTINTFSTYTQNEEAIWSYTIYIP